MPDDGQAGVGRRPSSKETFERSISSRCWWFTPYDNGWDPSRGLIAADNELREIVATEVSLGEVPQ